MMIVAVVAVVICAAMMVANMGFMGGVSFCVGWGSGWRGALHKQFTPRNPYRVAWCKHFIYGLIARSYSYSLALDLFRMGSFRRFILLLPVQLFQLYTQGVLFLDRFG